MRGWPKPWTRNPILQRYKFCNVYRELDTVTIWIREHWRDSHRSDPLLWFALAVARYINWPDTLAEIGYPVPFDADEVCKKLEARLAAKQQVFTGAYFINSIGPKIPSVIHDRLGKLWERRDVITDGLRKCRELAEVYEVLRAEFGFGTFMAGQVIADLKYVSRWQKAPDWHTWAVSGPGSRRGLNRVAGNPVNAPWREAEEAEWHWALTGILTSLNKFTLDNNMPTIHAQDLQGCLCEFDKYERVRLGEGKPRSLYPGLPD
jgi:hypothetical protein